MFIFLFLVIGVKKIKKILVDKYFQGQRAE